MLIQRRATAQAAQAEQVACSSAQSWLLVSAAVKDACKLQSTVAQSA